MCCVWSPVSPTPSGAIEYQLVAATGTLNDVAVKIAGAHVQKCNENALSLMRDAEKRCRDVVLSLSVATSEIHRYNMT